MKRAVLAPAIAAFAVSTLAATALATALAGCSSQSAYSQSDAERYIRQSESQWAESVATNDASVVKRILADDVVWVMPDGSVWKLAQTVADAERGPGGFTSDH